MSRLPLQILIPPLLPELLVLFPLDFFLLSLFSPLINGRKPLLSRGVLLSLGGILHHAVVHRLLLFPAHEGRGERS